MGGAGCLGEIAAADGVSGWVGGWVGGWERMKLLFGSFNDSSSFSSFLDRSSVFFLFLLSSLARTYSHFSQSPSSSSSFSSYRESPSPSSSSSRERVTLSLLLLLLIQTTHKHLHLLLHVPHRIIHPPTFLLLLLFSHTSYHVSFELLQVFLTVFYLALVWVGGWVGR